MKRPTRPSCTGFTVTVISAPTRPIRTGTGLQRKILTKVLLIFTDLYGYWAEFCFSKKVQKRVAE